MDSRYATATEELDLQAAVTTPPTPGAQGSAFSQADFAGWKDHGAPNEKLYARTLGPETAGIVVDPRGDDSNPQRRDAGTPNRNAFDAIERLDRNGGHPGATADPAPAGDVAFFMRAIDQAEVPATRPLVIWKPIVTALPLGVLLYAAIGYLGWLIWHSHL
jgi:hypothetical protein